MREDNTIRKHYWIVESTDNNGKVIYRKKHERNDTAHKDFKRLSLIGSVLIQRKTKETKEA